MEEEEIETTEDKWDRLFAKPKAKRTMRKMAREAREDYRAGRTTDIREESCPHEKNVASRQRICIVFN